MPGLLQLEEKTKAEFTTGVIIACSLRTRWPARLQSRLTNSSHKPPKPTLIANATTTPLCSPSPSTCSDEPPRTFSLLDALVPHKLTNHHLEVLVDGVGDVLGAPPVVDRVHALVQQRVAAASFCDLVVEQSSGHIITST